MKVLLLLPLLVAITSAAGQLPFSDLTYLGAQVLRVTPVSTSHLRYLNGLRRDTEYRFWTFPRAQNVPVDILAYRWNVFTLKATLEKVNMPYSIMITDVRKVIAEHKRINDIAREKAELEGKAMEWTAYHTYDEIMQWLDELTVTYPGLVTVKDIGARYEGRRMKMVKISTGGTGKPAIFVDGGMHAREWVSSSTVTYIMNELLSNSSAYTEVLATVDFYFIPVVNADGYTYTWTDDRLWRKTRSSNPGSDPGCVGTDPNRNWDFHWMETGASPDPCSDQYAGSKPFSEVECKNLRDQMLAVSSVAKVYLTYHSYWQYWMYPWGFERELCDDWQDLDALARDANTALHAVYGTNYSIGGTGVNNFIGAGASDDYGKGVAGIKYVLTVELRDTGTYGFLLPPDQIIPTGIETWASFKVIMNFVRDTYGKP